jgi:hypothetical protein
MKPGGGKHKGGNFERKICRDLTEWITGVRDPVIMWRSAASGAQATQLSKAGKKSKMHGDIIAIAPDGEIFISMFSVECKSYKTYDLEKFLYYDSGELAKWWSQCVSDARKSFRIPLLIVKRNGFEPICISEYQPKTFKSFFENEVYVFPFGRLLASNYKKELNIGE